MFAQFLRDRRGNIAILSTVMITSLVGVSGLVAEFGNGLLNRMQDQRVADIAAMGGGTVYNSTSSTSAMTGAVNNIATLNGLPTSDVSAALVASPSGDGNQAVQVTVQTSVPLVLSGLVWSKHALPIGVSSYAELKGGGPACIIALSQSGSGITLSGGTSVGAASCAVASNATVSVPCGTSITTKIVQYYSTTAPSEPCSGIQPPSGSTLSITKALTTDPFAGTTEVTGATGRLSTVAALTSPNAPTGPTVTGGTAVSFGYSQSTTQSELTADGCSGTFSGSTWTVTCSGSSSYKFGAISLAGGISVVFNTGGSASNTYSFNGAISNTGAGLSFGPGTFNITGGICTGGGTTTTFGSAGNTSSYNIGGSSNCGSGSCPMTNFSICNTGTSLVFNGTSTFSLAGGVYNGGGSTLTMAASSFSAGSLTSSCNGYGTGFSICQLGNPFTITGPTTFSFAGGVYNGGGETLTLGSGTGNSFKLGTASTGDSFYMGGGANTTFADATGQSFQLAGNLNVGSGGGSCLSLGASSEHDINGFLMTAGGNTLGSGIYTVAKYVWLGGNGGGDVTCNGATVGMSGTNVTFVVGGTSVPSGSCSGVTGPAFCLAAGYNHVTLTAPSSGNTEGLVAVGPTSSGNTAPVAFGEGASNTTLSGAFYFPYGSISLSGAATIGGGSGSSQCLMFVGSTVTVAGGSALASACNIPGSSSGLQPAVALVQ